MQIENVKLIYLYEREDNDGDLHLSRDVSCKIELKNVSFKYPGTEKYALKNVSLEILPGEKVSLVWHNGAGKSTLVKLILGLYEPECGDILLNGESIKKYNKEDLHKSIGVVFQDHQLFAFSLKENIAFESEIYAKTYSTLKSIGIEHMASKLPCGYDTPLSKEFDTTGTILSGGEAQMVCIARAVNKEGGFYVFDEPSSSLDPLTELKINEFLCAATNRTTIFISHRLSTAVVADKIFLFHNAELVEAGSHNELLAHKGKYHDFFVAQSKAYVGRT